METMTVLEKDAAYAKIAAEDAKDEGVPAELGELGVDAWGTGELRKLAVDARVTVRRGGAPAKGKCVVYWMQRSQRGRDSHGLNKAIAVGNALGLPVVAYGSGIPNFMHGNLRHYTFLNQGLPDI